MKSAVETLSPTRAKITVEVPFEELKPSLDAAYQAIAKQINIPGFRKGKVPPPVIDRQVGRGAVLDEAINDALPKLYVQALQENDLQPLAQPEIDVTKLEDNSLFEFTAEVDVRPTIEVPSYDAISVQVDDVTVSDDDVDEQVESLRERFATLKDVDRPAQDGDVTTIDLKATRDGEAVEGGEVSGYSYKLGSGEMLDGIDEALRGLSAGEEKTFTSSLLGGDLSGEEVEVNVKLSAVKEQELPELDDDFAQTASEFDTVAELRDDVATRLERGKRLEQAAAARDAVLEQLLDAAEIPLPESVVAEELAGRRQEIEQQLVYAGMTMEQYLDNEKQTVDEFEAELEKRVRDAMASQFLLDEIAKAEEIGVEQDELSAHLMRRAQQSGQNPDEFIKHMVEHNHIPEMVAEVVRGKALARIVEGATVTDESGNTVDLKNLRPDGSIGDPDADAEAAPTAADVVEAATEPVDSADEDAEETSATQS
ncbi:trigger factor [Marmoricola sp. URHB0036]|uniref:trigger factor n=1 Tax=Marmoricola sp. URHB0036 TaxID=1298863 RepID=UPI00040AA4C4|nr:trigger factor [Marmoricola sp. URHB0036]